MDGCVMNVTQINDFRPSDGIPRELTYGEWVRCKVEIDPAGRLLLWEDPRGTHTVPQDLVDGYKLTRRHHADAALEVARHIVTTDQPWPTGPPDAHSATDSASRHPSRLAKP